MHVGFIRIERLVASWNTIEIVDIHRGHHGRSTDEVAEEIRVEAQTRNCAHRQVPIHGEAVRCLVRAPELSLEDQTRAESVYPTAAEVLARVIGNPIQDALNAARTGRVVVDRAIAEPEKILRADTLINPA